MFLHDFIHVELPTDVVSQKILIDHGSWLGPLAVTANNENLEPRIRVGPGVGTASATRWVTKEVKLTLGEPHMHGDSIIVPIGWEAAGLTGMFPKLEGDLEIAPVGPTKTQISLMGRYSPPLGWTGKILDNALLHRLAEATIRSFLKQIAVTLEQSGREPTEQSSPEQPAEQPTVAKQLAANNSHQPNS